MGKSIRIDGEEIDIDDDTRIAELKDAYGAADADIATYRDGDDLKAVGDDETVAQIPDGSAVSFQPAEGQIFG